MSPGLQRKLEQLAERHEEVGRLLADPRRDRRQRALPRAVARVLAARAGGRRAARERRRRSATSPRRRRCATIRRCANSPTRKSRPREARIAALDATLGLLLIPVDPRDEGNLFLEVRAGTGGDEAAIFAGDLFRMYARYAERQRLAARNPVLEPRRARRLQGNRRAHRRPRRLFAGSSSNPARTACSACRTPKRRAASTPRPRRWRSCPTTRRSRRSRSIRPT